MSLPEFVHKFDLIFHDRVVSLFSLNKCISAAIRNIFIQPIPIQTGQTLGLRSENNAFYLHNEATV